MRADRVRRVVDSGPPPPPGELFFEIGATLAAALILALTVATLASASI